MFKVEVCQEKKTGGFRVWVTYCPGSDEMYEVFHHFYLFKSEKRAERLAQKVRRAGMQGIDLEFWGYYDSPCSPLAGVQQKSKAVKMTVPALRYSITMSSIRYEKVVVRIVGPRSFVGVILPDGSCLSQNLATEHAEHFLINSLRVFDYVVVGNNDLIEKHFPVYFEQKSKPEPTMADFVGSFTEEDFAESS